MQVLIFAFLIAAVSADNWGSSYSSYPSYSSYGGGYGSSLYGSSYGSGLSYGLGGASQWDSYAPTVYQTAKYPSSYAQGNIEKYRSSTYDEYYQPEEPVTIVFTKENSEFSGQPGYQQEVAGVPGHNIRKSYIIPMYSSAGGFESGGYINGQRVIATDDISQLSQEADDIGVQDFIERVDSKKQDTSVGKFETVSSGPIRGPGASIKTGTDSQGGYRTATVIKRGPSQVSFTRDYSKITGQTRVEDRKSTAPDFGKQNPPRKVQRFPPVSDSGYRHEVGIKEDEIIFSKDPSEVPNRFIHGQHGKNQPSHDIAGHSEETDTKSNTDNQRDQSGDENNETNGKANETDEEKFKTDYQNGDEDEFDDTGNRKDEYDDENNLDNEKNDEADEENDETDENFDETVKESDQNNDDRFTENSSDTLNKDQNTRTKNHLHPVASSRKRGSEGISSTGTGSHISFVMGGTTLLQPDSFKSGSPVAVKPLTGVVRSPFKSREQNFPTRISFTRDFSKVSTKQSASANARPSTGRFDIPPFPGPIVSQVNPRKITKVDVPSSTNIKLAQNPLDVKLNVKAPTPPVVQQQTFTETHDTFSNQGSFSGYKTGDKNAYELRPPGLSDEYTVDYKHHTIASDGDTAYNKQPSYVLIPYNPYTYNPSPLKYSPENVHYVGVQDPSSIEYGSQIGDELSYTNVESVKPSQYVAIPANEDESLKSPIFLNLPNRGVSSSIYEKNKGSSYQVVSPGRKNEPTTSTFFNHEPQLPVL